MPLTRCICDCATLCSISDSAPRNILYCVSYSILDCAPYCILEYSDNCLDFSMNLTLLSHHLIKINDIELIKVRMNKRKVRWERKKERKTNLDKKIE